MPFYKVWRPEGPREDYPLGPELDSEGAVMRFNGDYGRALGLELTTRETGKPCLDYYLIEQERDPNNHLLDGRRLPLFYK